MGEQLFPNMAVSIVPAVGFGFLFRFVCTWVLFCCLDLELPMFWFWYCWWEVIPWNVQIPHIYSTLVILYFETTGSILRLVEHVPRVFISTVVGLVWHDISKQCFTEISFICYKSITLKDLEKYCTYYCPCRRIRLLISIWLDLSASFVMFGFWNSYTF